MLRLRSMATQLPHPRAHSLTHSLTHSLIRPCSVQPPSIQYGNTPFMAAVQNGKEETVVLLIGLKADINLKDEVTRGKGWEGVARADELYTLYEPTRVLADNARQFLACIS